MKYLTEAEFDSAYLVKRTVARTFLKRAIELEVEDLKEALRLSSEAVKIFSHLPVKKNCKTMCCPHCNGLRLDTECVYDNHYGRLIFVKQHSFCVKCKHDDKFVERYQVFEFQL